MTRFRPTLFPLDARLTPAGWLDPAWGVAGVADATGPSPGVNGHALAALPDGGAVLAYGGATANDPATGSLITPPGGVTRLTPAGTPDPAFGVAGRADLPAGLFNVIDLAIDPAGYLYVLGNTSFTDGWRPVLARLTPAGAVDAGFAGDGTLELAPAAGGYPTGLAARPGGGVFVGHNYGGAVTVVAADGTTTAWTVPQLESIAIQELVATPDGGLVVAGTTSTGLPGGGSALATVVAKLTAAGQPDAGYGTGGRVILSAPEMRYTVRPAADGGFAVVATDYPTPVGWCGTVASQDVGLARLTPDGKLDLTFGGDGVAEYGLPADVSYAADAVPLPDGRTAVIAVGGPTYRGMYLRVFAADGSPDAGVADGGWLVLPAPADREWGYQGLAAAAPGRLLILGARTAETTPLWEYVTTLTAIDPAAPTPAGATAVATTAPAVVPPGVLVELLPLPPVVVVEPMPWVEPVTPTPVYDPLIAYVTPMSWSPTLSPDPPAPPEVPPLPQAVHLVHPSLPPQPVADPKPSVAGDLDGDGVADRVATDGPRVEVTSGADGRVLIPSFAPFEASYTGALNAVLADLGGDGRAELVVSPDGGGGPVVAVFGADGRERTRFWGIEDSNFRGGVRLAAGDLDADGDSDLVVTAGDGGGPRVAVYDGRSVGAGLRRLVNDFFAFEEGQRGGAYVAVSDGTLVFAAGPGGGPRARAVDARTLLKAGVSTLDALPAGGLKLDRFVGDPDGRRGVALDVRPTAGGLEVTAAQAGDGRPQVLVRGGRVVEADPLVLSGVALGS